MHGFYSRAELEQIATQVLGERLDGRPKQGIHESSTVQNYVIGSRKQMDERAFRYACIGAGGFGLHQYGVGWRTTVTGTSLTGANIIAGAVNTHTVTLVLAGVGADDYKYGYMGIRDNSAGPANWGAKILANTASDASNHVTFTLEAPLPMTLEAADTVTVTPSPWSDVVDENVPGTCVFAFVGVSLIYPPGNYPGRYVWLQTWGPLAEPHIAVSHEGAANFERMLYFMGQGAMQCADPADGQSPGASGRFAAGMQPAGWYMPDSSGGDLAHPVVWLTIAP